MHDEGPSPNSGVARLIVLLCAFALATVGAFTAFFVTDILSALFKLSARPSTLTLVLCALVPIVAAVGAVAVSIRAHSSGRILTLGCGTLLLGGLVTAIVIAAAAL